MQAELLQLQLAALPASPCCSPRCSPGAGAQRKDFNGAVRRLVERWYGREPFDLPLETKLFVLTSLKEDSLRDPPFRPVHGTLFQA